MAETEQPESAVETVDASAGSVDQFGSPSPVEDGPVAGNDENQDTVDQETLIN